MPKATEGHRLSACCQQSWCKHLSEGGNFSSLLHFLKKADGL